MWTQAIIATSLITLATASSASAHRVDGFWHYDTRPTRAALIACQMGPHFLGEAWRGKRYRPFTRTGRPRICLSMIPTGTAALAQSGDRFSEKIMLKQDG